MAILVTGAAGFIGSNFVLDWFNYSDEKVISFDLLTYAGNLENLKSLELNPRYFFIKGDICDQNLIHDILNKHKIRAIINFAAESHVDRSITGPADFIQTNIVGTYKILEASRTFFNNLCQKDKKNFRFVHISTDEVYGSLENNEKPFSETNPFQPNSPYSASKASSDHLVRAWFHTYNLPVLTTNCSNNYGPYQFPEKLIPLCIINALKGKPLPIYGDGLQIRDWLYVVDHCSAIRAVLDKGLIGETYNIGGRNEMSNINLVRFLCHILDELMPKRDGSKYENQIVFVKDRPGHDKRYAINSSKLETELNWKPKETFETGIRKTVKWYLANQNWIENVLSGDYQDWISKQYI